MHLKTSDRLLSIVADDTRSTGQAATLDNGELPTPSNAIIRRLNEQATFKLAEITRESNISYDVAEVIAAKNLLARSTQRRQR